MFVLFFVFVYLLLWIIQLLQPSQRSKKYKIFIKPKQKKPFRNNKKPDWVVKKIIYYKAIMPKVSGYKIADIFNRQFSHLETVSKTYVYNIIRKYNYAILLERKNIKTKKPYPVATKKTWGIDLTGKHDTKKKNQHIFGIVDHGSRFNIVLKYLKDKSSKRLLFEIYKAVKKHGKPGIIRTDNDIVFRSKLFKLGLRIMGIKHQLTDIGCPWQKNIWNVFSRKPSWMRVSIKDDTNKMVGLNGFLGL